MAALTTTGLTFKTEANILKAVYSEPFSSRSVKTKIFILQIDNKITNAAGITEKRKIRYKISLLRKPAAE